MLFSFSALSILSILIPFLVVVLISFSVSSLPLHLSAAVLSALLSTKSAFRA